MNRKAATVHAEMTARRTNDCLGTNRGLINVTSNPTDHGAISCNGRPLTRDPAKLKLLSTALQTPVRVCGAFK